MHYQSLQFVLVAAERLIANYRKLNYRNLFIKVDTFRLQRKKNPITSDVDRVSVIIWFSIRDRHTVCFPEFDNDRARRLQV